MHRIRTDNVAQTWWPGLCLCAAVASAAADIGFTLEAASGDTYALPHDIVLAADGRHLYVADNGNHRIAVLDAESLRELGGFGLGEVSQPHDVAFDQHGRLLVADTGNSRIAIFEVTGVDGRLVGSLSEGLSRPEGVAVAADGRVFATGARSNNLVVYRDGTRIAETGGFSSPHDVEIDPQGQIWVADAGNDRLVRLNDALEVTVVLAGAEYRFNGPRYLDFDTSGLMYVADKYSNSIKVIDSGHRLVQTLGTAAGGKGEGVFDRPEGVEIRGSDIWFSDTYNNRIVRYRFDRR